MNTELEAMPLALLADKLGRGSAETFPSAVAAAEVFTFPDGKKQGAGSIWLSCCSLVINLQGPVQCLA